MTVSHDSAAELRALLDSVERRLPGTRVVIADSGSADGSRELATIDMGANVGYGRGVNAAIRQVQEPVTVVVNPDVELIDDSLSRLAEELLRPGAPERLLAPVVQRPDGSRQDSVQLEPASAPLMLSALVPPAALPGPLRRAVEPWRSETPRRVGWAVGCCVAGRTETLLRLGPFDESIFLYGEDLELGLRARDEGVETWFWPDARIVHHGAHSTERSFGGEAFELLARQRREVVARRRGARRARLDDVQQAVTFADRIALKRLMRRRADRERAQLAALRRARRG